VSRAKPRVHAENRIELLQQIVAEGEQFFVSRERHGRLSHGQIYAPNGLPLGRQPPSAVP
jgi:hypothetical protein